MVERRDGRMVLRSPQGGAEHDRQAEASRGLPRASNGAESDPVPLLELRGVEAAYDQVQVLFQMAFNAYAGEILCLVGRNGAGKTSTLRAIMGLLPLTAGSIRFLGEPLERLPGHEVPRRGIGLVPQGRRLFGDLSVAQNLEIGLRVRQVPDATRESVLTLFPVLAARLKQRAATLSGGEQQMLAMARALCLRPRLLLLDEPTEGLQPSMIMRIREVIEGLRDQNVGVLLVEQRVDAVLELADRVVFVEHGRTMESLDAGTLTRQSPLFNQYLGVR